MNQESSTSAAPVHHQLFQGFDKFLQVKRQTSSALPTSSQLPSSSAFERFSSQFEKQFSKPPHSSNNTSCYADTKSVIDALTTNPHTKQADGLQRQVFTQGLKARDLHVESTKQYNRDQDQFCRRVGTHPDTYKLHELDNDDDSESSSVSSTSGDIAIKKCNKTNEVGLRPSEQNLKDKAFQRNLFDILSQDFTCPPATCPLKGQCLNTVLFLDVLKEMTWFWGGDSSKPAHTTSDRKAKVIDKMKRSIFKDLSSSNNPRLHLVFSMGSANVCESVYLKLIGHPSSKMWQRCKNLIFGSYSRNNGSISEADMQSIEAAISMKRHKSERRPQPKADSARSFITYLMQFYSSLSPNDGEEHIRILPFETVSQLYEEYRAHCQVNSVNTTGEIHCIASKETFRKQWKEIYKAGQVKLSRGKGTFPTCDICNNANDMLAFSKSTKWTKRQRDIIISFKSHHLKQQAAERAALESLKRIACTEWTAHNQPKMALFFGDAMTNHASKTPKYGRRHGKAESAFFQNRVFGFEVYCGPIQGEILIHSDELVRNGANYNIEVHRLGILLLCNDYFKVLMELSKLLKDHNMLMPNEIHFQLDNCGDNKNKEFFMFCSILVEAGYFQSITVGFLIVGHTHASIDQYFSCLRRKIRNAAFIASPMALQHLFSLPISEKKKSRFRKPIAQIQLYFVHDYRSALAPYFNPAITNYNIPYQFKFFNVLSKCVTQHKQFADAKLPWLPLQTSEVLRTVEQLYKARIFGIENTHSLSTETGKAMLAEHMGFHEMIDTSCLGNAATKEALENLQAFNSILPDLQNMESCALAEQVLRHSDEANGVDDVERYDKTAVRDAQLSNQKALQSLNTKTHGFLFWIDYMVKPDLPPPPLITMVKPVPINPKQIWDQYKSPDLEQNLLEVETSAIEYLTAREENHVEHDNGIAIVELDSDDESIFGEIARKTAEVGSANVEKLKKKSTNKRVQKTDLEFVLHAVANIKAAVKFMQEVKIKSNVVNLTSRGFSELSYEKVFSQKTVTADDLKYFADRATTESILNVIQTEIDKLPEFEWFQKSTLSEEQLRIMELQQVLLVEQAAAIREACNKVLMRRRESTENETITRITNEMQRKEEAKALERQLKEVQKEVNRERKLAEKERKKEEKDAAKSARRKEKKKRVRHPLNTFNHTAEVQEEEEEVEGADQQLRQQFINSSAADDPNTSSEKNGDIRHNQEEAMELETVARNRQFSTKDADEGEEAHLIFPNNAEPKCSKSISEYSNTEKIIIKKVQQITQRFLSKPLNMRIQMHDEDGCFKQNKRRAANSEEDLVRAIVSELNFSQYKAAYAALIEFFDLPVSGGGYHSGSKISNDSERRQFLTSFGKSYYQKLHWERMDFQFRCLNILSRY